MAKHKKKKHYIDNKEFEETIYNYLDDPRQYEEKLIKQLDLLISSILISFKFTREKGSAFNYFTTVIVNNLKLIYTKNKKYQEKIQAYRDRKIKTFLEE